ncbi:MAG: tryptophan synthase subunit alpha [Planctomycetota bacterium]
MTNRIDTIFKTQRDEHRKGLMPFVCGGHPTPESLPTLLPALEAGGASIVEIGIPFSDPIADGPVIAAAMHEALQSGVRPGTIFDQVRAARESVGLGLVAMISVSLVEGLGGPAAFSKRASEAGFDGLIVPDCPLDEAGRIRDAAGEHGLTLSLLVAPTTPPKRAAEIAQACTGFVYLVARAGITGERADAPKIEPMTGAIREATDIPIACGFGISTPEHVAAVVEHADAAIVGSALVRRLADAQNESRDLAETAKGYTQELAAGLAAATAEAGE